MSGIDVLALTGRIPARSPFASSLFRSARIMAIAGAVGGSALATPALAGNPPPNGGGENGPQGFVELGATIVAADPTASDQFGCAVAIEGDTAVMGAWLADNGDARSAGAAYVFRWTGSAWTQVAKLTAPDTAAEDRFGLAVAIHNDVIVVGACMADTPGAVDSGAAYVYRRNGSVWAFESKLVASDPFRVDHFGRFIAMSDVGIAVGAPREERQGGMDQGAVYIFERQDGTWAQKSKLTAPLPGSGDCFGFRLAMDNTTLAVGSQYNDAPGQPASLYDAGSVDIFTYQDGQWVHTQLLRPDTVVTGANFGSSLSMGSGLLVVGAEHDTTSSIRGGSAYVFSRHTSGRWRQSAKLLSPQPAGEDFFGSTVAISGSTILVAAEKADLGSEDSGSVQPFHYSTIARRWVPGAAFNTGLNQGGEFFGADLAFSQGLVLASAPFVDLTDAIDAGATFAFTTDEDCNGDGEGDVSQIATGKLSDVNANGVPDVCECLADWDHSGKLSSTDVSAFVNDWLFDQESGSLNADLDGNGISNSADLSTYINVYFEGCD